MENIKPWIHPDKLYPLPSSGALRSSQYSLDQMQHWRILNAQLNIRLRHICETVIKDNPGITYNELAELLPYGVSELVTILYGNYNVT